MFLGRPQNDTVRLLWAYHPDDPVDPESPRPRLHYHGSSRRGVRSMFLLERGHRAPTHSRHTQELPVGFPDASLPPSRSPGLPPRFPPTGGHHHNHHHHHRPPLTRSWVLTNNGVEVGANSDTVYWCKVFKRPQLIQKNHVIRVSQTALGWHFWALTIILLCDATFVILTSSRCIFF